MMLIDSIRCSGVLIRPTAVTLRTELRDKVTITAMVQLDRSRPMSKIPTASKAMPPRLLGVNEASRYWGISRNTFLKLVNLGVAPPPLHIPETGRVLYDRVQLDAAIEARAQRHGEV